MRNRPDAEDSAFKASLPSDLQGLDRELSALRIEERPSFAPELEGELIRAWQEDSVRRKTPWARTLLAACLGGIMVAGVAVPSARGAVGRFVRTVLEEAAPNLFAPPPEPVLPGIRVSEPGVPEATTHTVLSPAGLDSPDQEQDESELGGEFLPDIGYSLPELLHRQEAEALIASFYPMILQEAGVGGVIDLMIWVDSLGVADLIQFRSSSGNRSLDRAAMRAARELRFRPAHRAGIPVGTWVEFEVHFVPPSGGSGEDQESSSLEDQGGP
ncbi:energy transducer TonB [Gemmatimonadota bacterium]